MDSIDSKTQADPTTGHTPTPWRINERGEIVRADTGSPVWIAGANAALIVRAVNSHDALVDALEDALADLQDIAMADGADASPAMQKAKAVLKLARGQ